MIRGTVSTRTPAAGPALRTQEADSGRVSAVGSVLDAVVYVERLDARAQPIVPTTRSLFRMELKDREFRPRILAVPIGSSVAFTNNDSVFHNAFSVSPSGRFDLGRCGGGHTRRVSFEKPGLVKVYCKLHSDMAAYILVVPSPFFARPDSSGRFVLPRMPKGKYVVNVWHPDFPVIRRNITVTDGADSEIAVTLGS